MSDGVSVPDTALPTGSARDASDESGAESDTEALRGRLARAERELQALRCPLLGARSLCELPVARYWLRELLPRAAAALEPRPGFLAGYLDAMRTRSPPELDRLTCEVMSSIEDALRQRPGAGGDASCSLGEQRVVLCAFLCAACLSDTPRVRDARPVLRQLLADTGEEEWELGAPRLEDLEGMLEAWAGQERDSPAQDAARVMLCGRVLAVAPPALRPPLLRRLAALLGDKLAAAATPHRKVGVCKLQILFGADEKINIHKRTPRKPGAGRRH